MHITAVHHHLPESHTSLPPSRAVESKFFLELTAADTVDRQGPVAVIVALVQKDGANKVLLVSGLLAQLSAAARDAKSATAREGAFLAFAGLADGAPRAAEPFLIAELENILEKCSDKVCHAALRHHINPTCNMAVS